MRLPPLFNTLTVSVLQYKTMVHASLHRNSNTVYRHGQMSSEAAGTMACQHWKAMRQGDSQGERNEVHIATS